MGLSERLDVTLDEGTGVGQTVIMILLLLRVFLSE